MLPESACPRRDDPRGIRAPEGPARPGARPEEEAIRWFHSSRVPDTVPSPEHERTLELFKYDGCPYCTRVMSALRRMPEVEVAILDTLRDRAAADRLRQQTGRGQVPCLFVDGEPLFESADIVRWLEAHHAWRSARTGAAGT